MEKSGLQNRRTLEEMALGEYLLLVGDSGGSLALSGVRILERPREFPPAHPLAANPGEQVAFWDITWRAKRLKQEESCTYYTKASPGEMRTFMPSSPTLWMRKGDSGVRRITHHRGQIPHHRLAGRGDGTRRIQDPRLPRCSFGLLPPGGGDLQAETRLAFDEEGTRLKGDRVILATIRIEE